MTTAMNFVGIDPSVTATGVAVLNSAGEVLTATAIKCGGHGLPRVLEYRTQVLDLLPEGPAHVAIEGYAYSNKFNLATLVELGTALRLAVLDRGWTYVDVAPTALKAFALMPKGSKAKDKPFVQVKERWGFVHKSGDVVDAYVLAQIARADAGAARRELHIRQIDVLTGLKQK